MRKYKLEQPVNWERVLRALRKRIEIDKNVMERRYKNIMRAPSTGEYLYQELRGNLDAYQALRKFLGFAAPTKIEQEVENLLRPLQIDIDTK